jgi:hypothetical protein
MPSQDAGILIPAREDDMLAALLLVLVADTAPPSDYRQAELTDMDKRNIALVCEEGHWTRASRADCVKAETEKLKKQKQAQVDARAAEALTAKETAR